MGCQRQRRERGGGNRRGKGRLEGWDRLNMAENQGGGGRNKMKVRWKGTQKASDDE